MRQHFTLTIARVGSNKSFLNECYDLIKYNFCYRKNANETTAEEPNFEDRNTECIHKKTNLVCDQLVISLKLTLFLSSLIVIIMIQQTEIGTSIE